MKGDLASNRKEQSSLPSSPSSGIAPKLSSNKPIVLVGKGVCFDTGGINLKSANSMKTMKHDMAGSSTALGVFWALTSEVAETSNPVECWLPIVENNINRDAFRPDDVS